MADRPKLRTFDKPLSGGQVDRPIWTLDRPP